MKSTVKIIIKNVCLLLFFIIPLTVFSQDATGKDKSLQLEEDNTEDSSAGDKESAEGESSDTGSSETEDTRTLIEKTIAKDINTATYYELALWCMQLGLDDAGDLTKLKTRLFDFYKVTEKERLEGVKEDVKKKIEIKSAKRSEYFTIEEVDENYLLLEGDVLIEVYDYEDKVTHQIKAHRVIFNQTEKVLTAEEDIEYILTRSEGKPEKFTGESFSFNVDTSEGVFYRSKGETEKEIEKDKTTNFVYMGETISRLTDDTIILENGTITSDQSPDNPYWMIKATKIWVLAPGEWAVRDLVLYIGKVPIFYFPFFFYPGDELFFHPVIGYRDREGNFIQTTTYLIGEREDKDSPFSFLKIAADDSKKYKKEIKGLFLRTTDKKKDETKPVTWFLKLMADIYSRLGGFFGIEGNFPETFSVKGGIAFSRNIYNEGGRYTPYQVDENGNLVDHWNSTSIFGAVVPFRYALESTFKLSYPIIALNAQVELFSDPYFPIDFYEREEVFNIAELIGMEEIDETATLEPELQQTLKWSANTSIYLSRYMPNPYIEKFDISQLNLGFDWQSKSIEPAPAPAEAVDPSRQFYYPDKLTIPNFKMGITGNILTIPESARATPSPEPAGTTQKENEPVKEYGMGFRPPYEFEQDQETPEPGIGSTGEDEAGTGGNSGFKEPAMKEDAESLKFRAKDTKFSINYSLAPEILVEHQFFKENMNSIDDVDFAPLYTQFLGNAPASISYELGIWGDFLKFNGIFTMNNKYQTRFNISEELSEEEVETNELTDNQITGIWISKTFTTTLFPLIDIPVLSTSFIQHNVLWNFYKYKFKEMIEGEPLFESELFLWDENIDDKHSIKANMIFIPWEQPYTYYIETDLPPDLYKIYSYLEFSIWMFRTRGSVWINEVDPELDLDTLDEATRKKYGDGWYWINPITITESVAFENILTFSQDLRYDWENQQWEDTTSTLALLKLKPADPFILNQTLVFDIEENKVTKSESSFNLWGLQLKLLAQDMIPSYWDPANTTWQNEDAEEQLLLNSLDTSFILKATELNFWKYRIKWEPSIESNLRYDFQRFTESIFNFTLKMNFTIAEFVDLTFKSVSYNKNIYRYIPGIQEIEGFEDIEYINPFYDLLRSFNFFNEEDRRDSGFKLDSLEISLVHHLYDWDLTFTYKGQYIEEVNDAGKKIKRWNPVYSIFIQWKPIPEIKKEITGDADTLNIGVD